MEPMDYMQAARVPRSLKPQRFGQWTIKRLCTLYDPMAAEVGWDDMTVLRHVSAASLPDGETVMEDSRRELRKHLPIWLAAHGRVLVTGLGLGCVVRGLLASPRVEHVDVVEIDRDILRIVGREFVWNRRVTLHRGDARDLDLWTPVPRWDFAWHDLHSTDESLDCIHVRLMWSLSGRCGRQGAWGLHREIKRFLPTDTLGIPRRAP